MNELEEIESIINECEFRCITVTGEEMQKGNDIEIDLERRIVLMADDMTKGKVKAILRYLRENICEIDK